MSFIKYLENTAGGRGSVMAGDDAGELEPVSTRQVGQIWGE